MKAAWLLAGVLALGALAPAKGLYSEKDAVVSIAGDEFEETVLQSQEQWLVEFFAPWCGHCKQLAPEYKKAAKELIGTAKLGAVDCDKEKELCGKFDVKGFPTLKWFGEDKTKPKDYNGAREAAAMVQFAQQETGGSAGSSSLAKSVPYLGMYSFLFSDPSVPSVLVFVDSATAPSWLSSVAVKYKEGKKKTVNFGFVGKDVEPPVAPKFGVKKLPAAVVVVPTGEGEGYFVPFKGALPDKASAAVKALKEFVDSVTKDGVPEAQRSPAPAFPPPDRPRKQAEVFFHQLTPENADNVCFGGRRSICVLALVKAAGDEFPESAELQLLAKKYRNDPLAFAWVDPAGQPSFAEAFGVAVGELPRVVVVKHGKRARFALHDGAVTAAALTPLVDRVLGGDVQFKAIARLPELEPDYLKNVGADDGEL